MNVFTLFIDILCYVTYSVECLRLVTDQSGHVHVHDESKIIIIIIIGTMTKKDNIRMQFMHAQAACTGNSYLHKHIHRTYL